VLGVARVLVVGEEEGNDVGGNCHYMTEEQESADDAGSRVPLVNVLYSLFMVDFQKGIYMD
jgi:hypothetical protein